VPHLGTLAGATVRLWALEGTAWHLLAGPEAAAPRAPRDAGHQAAAFVAIAGDSQLFLEIVPQGSRPADELAAMMLPLAEELIHAERSTAALTDELAARYEEIDLLYSIGEMLGRAESVEAVAAHILREVSAVIGARRAGLRVFDEESGLLRMVALVGEGEETIPAVVPIDATDEVVIARAWRTGRIQTGIQPEWVDGEVLAVPIIHAASGQPTRVVGTIALADRAGGGAFTREETKLLAAVATQVGAALENARLVAAERDQLRVSRELELAHDLQVKLMPTAAVLAGEAEVAVHSVPAESLGGDFYTFTRLGQGRIGVMLGDVSSHGFSAALIAAQVMAAAGIHVHADITPQQTLGLLRASLEDELASTEMYLSLVYAVFDPVTGTLTWSNAGHPYAFQVPREGRVRRLETTAPPLGLVQGEDFGSAACEWRFGEDLLVLCTDGLTDAAREDGERYGVERLLARLEEGSTLSPEALLRHVLDDVAAFGAVAGDDCTLLVIRA
jgi:sigma-B regulation protein RsbU (phosphoserine phosphatase)